MDEKVSGRPSSSSNVSWRPAAGDLAILSSLAEGLTLESVARRHGISERTVRRRLRAIADAIGVDSTIEAVVYAVRSRLI